tara:strand:- start:743 stop:952 length:210 start_codon:yes stop_codon:yes gene_type:complete
MRLVARLERPGGAATSAAAAPTARRGRIGPGRQVSVIAATAVPRRLRAVGVSPGLVMAGVRIGSMLGTV